MPLLSVRICLKFKDASVVTNLESLEADTLVYAGYWYQHRCLYCLFDLFYTVVSTIAVKNYFLNFGWLLSTVSMITYLKKAFAFC